MIAGKFNLNTLVDRMTLLHQAKMNERDRLSDVIDPVVVTEEPRRRALPVLDLKPTTSFLSGKTQQQPARESPSSSLDRDSVSMSTNGYHSDDSDREETGHNNPFVKKGPAQPAAAKHNPFTKKGAAPTTSSSASAGQKRAMSSTDMGDKDAQSEGIWISCGCCFGLRLISLVLFVCFAFSVKVPNPPRNPELQRESRLPRRKRRSRSRSRSRRPKRRRKRRRLTARLLPRRPLRPHPQLRQRRIPSQPLPLLAS